MFRCIFFYLLVFFCETSLIFQFSLEGKVSQLLRTSSCGGGLKKRRKYTRFYMCILHVICHLQITFWSWMVFSYKKPLSHITIFQMLARDGMFCPVYLALTLLSYILTLNLLHQNRCCLFDMESESIHIFYIIPSYFYWVSSLKKKKKNHSLFVTDRW